MSASLLNSKLSSKHRNRSKTQPKAGYQVRKPRCQRCKRQRIGPCHIPIVGGACELCQKAGDESAAECIKESTGSQETVADPVMATPDIPAWGKSLETRIHTLEIHCERSTGFSALTDASNLVQHHSGALSIVSAIPIDHMTTSSRNNGSTAQSLNPTTMAVEEMLHVSFTDSLKALLHEQGTGRIATFLAVHHVSRKSNPFNIVARLLSPDDIVGIDRNAMYFLVTWTERTDQGTSLVTAAIKYFEYLDFGYLSLIIHYAPAVGDPQENPVQSRYEWYSWKEEELDNLKHLIMVSGNELELLPERAGNNNVIWFCEESKIFLAPISMSLNEREKYCQEITERFRLNSHEGVYPDASEISTWKWTFSCIGTAFLCRI